MDVLEKILELKNSIRQVAEEAGHAPEAIRLVLVTKNVDPAKIREAYDAGERDFGENRVQEWQEKKDLLPPDVRWHLIGHLQTNKVKHVVGQVHLIHSLDRIELADEIEKQARNKGVGEVSCLLQVNISGEDTKFGVAPEKAGELAGRIFERSRIRLRGLMAIGPLTEDKDRVRECFRKTRELLEDLKKNFPGRDWTTLSMGMSDDYKIAIEEGANMLRIGSLVFPKEGLK